MSQLARHPLGAAFGRLRAGLPAPFLVSYALVQNLPDDHGNVAHHRPDRLLLAKPGQQAAKQRLPRKAVPIVESPGYKMVPQLSPDNEYVAYVSDESGREQA